MFFPLHFVFALHRYRDDENDSDDEVDWEALAKAAKEYQRRNGKLVQFSFFCVLIKHFFFIFYIFGGYKAFSLLPRVS